MLNSTIYVVACRHPSDLECDQGYDDYHIVAVTDDMEYAKEVREGHAIGNSHRYYPTVAVWVREPNKVYGD